MIEYYYLLVTNKVQYHYIKIIAIRYYILTFILIWYQG